MQVLEQWCIKKILFQGSNVFKKGLGRKVWEGWTIKQWRFGVFLQKKTTKLAVRGSTSSLAVGAFNALAGYHCFNRTSIGGWPRRRIPQPGRKDYWMRESVFNTPQLDLDQARGTGRLIPWSVEPVGPMPRPIQRFGSDNHIFQLKTFLNKFEKHLTQSFSWKHEIIQF